MENRQRIRDLRVTRVGTYKQDTWSKANCSSTAVWSNIQSVANNAGVVGSYEEMNDCLIPDFRRRIAQGEVFMNPLSKQKMTIDVGYGQSLGEWKQLTPVCDAPYTYQQHWKSYLQGDSTFGRRFSGFNFVLSPGGSLLAPASVISAEELEDAVNEASTACLSERGRSHINLWETLAEADKSFGLIGSAMHEISRIVDRSNGVLGRRNGKRLLNTASGAAGLWLGYRYGLKPLMDDVDGICEGLQKQLGKVRQTSRGEVKISESVSTNTATRVYSTWDCTYTHQIIEEYKIRAMSLDEHVASLGYNLGLSGKDRATLFWEMIPYSFVLDWAVNVGDFIGALVPAFGFTQLGSCVTIKRETVDNFTVGGFGMTSGSITPVTSPLPMGCTMKYESMTRVPLLAAPKIVVRNDFKMHKLVRAADAISLLVKRLR